MNSRYFNIAGMQVITPNNNVDIDKAYSDGIYVESAGNIKVAFKDGTTHTFKNLVAKDTIQANIARVYSTGTTVTSTDIFGLKLDP